jgi:hypothetical protein
MSANKSFFYRIPSAGGKTKTSMSWLKIIVEFKEISYHSKLHLK